MPDNTTSDVLPERLAPHLDAILQLVEDASNADSFGTRMRPYVPAFSLAGLYGIAIALLSGYAGLFGFFATLTVALTLLDINERREQRRLKLIMEVLYVR
jgi:hypothetical protein